MLWGWTVRRRSFRRFRSSAPPGAGAGTGTGPHLLYSPQSSYNKPGGSGPIGGRWGVAAGGGAGYPSLPIPPRSSPPSSATPAPVAVPPGVLKCISRRRGVLPIHDSLYISARHTNVSLSDEAMTSHGLHRGDADASAHL